MAAMREFLADLEKGIAAGRYVAGSLPEVIFNDGSFDLALCGHLLFFYFYNLSLDFHIASIREMLRVAPEARIFPIVDLNGRKSRYIKPVLSVFKDCSIDIRKVDYEFLAGGNEMMIISRR